jgi:hypothetical protein
MTENSQLLINSEAYPPQTLAYSFLACKRDSSLAFDSINLTFCMSKAFFASS